MQWQEVPLWRPALTAAIRVAACCLRIIDFVVQQRKARGKASPHHGLSNKQRRGRGGKPGETIKCHSTPIILFFPYFGISKRCPASYFAGFANSASVAYSNQLRCVIFIYKMLEWVITWLIEEQCCSDRLLTPTQLAACQRRWVNDIWARSLKTKQRTPTFCKVILEPWRPSVFQSL